MNKEQELKRQLKILRENKGNLGENTRVTSYRYLEGKLEGYQEAKQEFIRVIYDEIAKGTKKEIKIAKNYKIPVFYDRKDLLQWRTEKIII